MLFTLSDNIINHSTEPFEWWQQYACYNRYDVRRNNIIRVKRFTGKSVRWTERPRDYCSPGTWRRTWLFRFTGKHFAGPCHWPTTPLERRPTGIRCTGTNSYPKCLTRRWTIIAVIVRKTGACRPGCRTFRHAITVSRLIQADVIRDDDVTCVPPGLDCLSDTM